MLFSPVCFFSCRAAWPEVIKLAEHECKTIYEQEYLFFLLILKVLKSPIPLNDDYEDSDFSNIILSWTVVSRMTLSV